MGVRQIQGQATLPCRNPNPRTPLHNYTHLSGTGDSKRDSRESIRAKHSQLKPLFLYRVRPIRSNHSNFRFARIEPDSRESCESIRANHATKIHISAVVLLSGPSLGVLNVIIWSKFVFYKTPIVKNTIKIGVSALLFWKKLRAQILNVIIWSKLTLFKTHPTWTR